MRSVNNGTVEFALDGRRLDHWHSVVWDPGIVGSQALSVCYDCLCLMTLFRAVMSLVHDWAGGLYGLGVDLGIAEQLPGKEVVCLVCVHAVMWIGCVTMWRGRSKALSW